MYPIVSVLLSLYRMFMFLAPIILLYFCIFCFYIFVFCMMLYCFCIPIRLLALGGALLSYWLHYQPMLTSSLTFSNFSAICFGYFPLAFKVMIRVLVKIRQNLQIDFSPCMLFFAGWNSWSMIHLIS